MVDALQNWINWFHFLFLEGGPLVILIDCVIFLSSFPDATKVSVGSFFPRTARLWNSLLIECLPLTCNCRLLLKRFPVCFSLSELLFLVTPCLIVAVQPCMEWIPIKKTILMWNVIYKANLIRKNISWENRKSLK